MLSNTSIYFGSFVFLVYLIELEYDQWYHSKQLFTSAGLQQKDIVDEAADEYMSPPGLCIVTCDRYIVKQDKNAGTRRHRIGKC